MLSTRQRLMLGLRLAGDLSQRQIARELGVSQMTVSRVLRAIREQLVLASAVCQQPD
jgi:RNA polymerase sigma factor (sigma-70 family)